MVSTKTNLPGAQHTDEAACQHWLDSLGPRYSSEEKVRLEGACRFALGAHRDTRRDTGETSLRHALATAEILAGLRLDCTTLAAALLNGVLPHPEVSEESLQREFGKGVARMVADLGRIAEITNVDAVVTAKDETQHAENLRRLLLGMAEDIRVVLVVLAERLHLMRRIKGLDDEARRKIARDTQQIYAPLANRLGIGQLKWELEDLSLRYLDPEEYRRIASLLDERRADREHFIAQVIEAIKTKFQELGIEAEVTGRAKHIFSIWKKMQRKAVDFDRIFDVRALRILVGDVAECYAALGVVHGLWEHIPGEFDDYIATPKANLYQSLHTAVVGPDGKPLEIQIRTQDMHRHAELGVAAHWRYKESAQHDSDFERRVAWMRHWLELKDAATADDLLERFKSELEASHIYVLTPQAKVIELPKGATPLDFAYAIHSEIGNRCRGARVDNRLLPLNQPLQSGYTVEILTAKNATPSRDWLIPGFGYLKTSRARNRVRQWFKQQDYDQHLSQGRTALERELTRQGISEKPDLERLTSRYGFHKPEDLLAAIGRGDVSAAQAAGALGERRPTQAKAPPPPTEAPPAPRPGRGEVVVAGVDDLMTHLSRCCKPVPPDRIVGYVTRGRGVSVHREDCPNLRHLPDEERARLIEVDWGQRIAEATFAVDILVLAADRKGLLRDISAILTNEDLNVLAVSTQTDDSRRLARMLFTVEIHNAEQLAGLMNKVIQIPDVLEVDRRR